MEKSKKQRAAEQRLAKLTHPHETWRAAADTDQNQKAIWALREFASALCQMKPQKNYRMGDWGHVSYLVSLGLVRQALYEAQYPRACHEIRSLLHRELFLQPRVYYNLLRLLDDTFAKAGIPAPPLRSPL